jgi:hypothetical protein
MVPTRTFADYYKFCFDRNPWDFVVSLFHYRLGKGKLQDRDFDSFVHNYPIVPNWSLYTAGNNVIVNEIFRYEELPQTLPLIAAKLGVSLSSLPTDKSRFRTTRDYRSFYSPSTKDLIAERWAKTIRLLNYEF